MIENIVQTSQEFISYSLDPMNIGSIIKAKFRKNLYNESLLNQYADSVLDTLKFNDARFNLTKQIEMGKFKIKFSLTSNENDPSVSNSLQTTTPIDAVLERNDYGGLLYKFLCMHYLQQIQNILTKEEYSFFISNQSIGLYLVDLFKFYDGAYISNPETSSLKTATSVYVVL